ncbi:MAG: hypothetical protein WCK78_19630 [Paludibacter sp.]
MKKTIILTILVFSKCFLYSQKIDKIVNLSGDTLKVTISVVTEDKVQFKYPNEDIINEILKSKIEKIIYYSGRIEEINQKRQKKEGEIFVTHLESDIKGYKYIGEISAKTPRITFNSAGQAEISAYKKIKEEAIKIGADAILIVSFTNNVVDLRYMTYQATIRAIAYKM